MGMGWGLDEVAIEVAAVPTTRLHMTKYWTINA